MPLVSSSALVEQLCARLERVLLRYQELQRTQSLLRDQVLSLQAENELLQSRLFAARGRINSLVTLVGQQSLPSQTLEETGI